jgi:dTDP-4-dehydrorhamnose 3,5-epimerase
MLNEPRVIDIKSFTDSRGLNYELFRIDHINTITGLNLKQINVAVSNNSAIRGIHFAPPGTSLSKIVSCIQGNVLDFVIDLRKSKLTFGQIFEFNLSSQHPSLLVIPDGFGHAYQTLSEQSTIVYGMTKYFGEYEDLALNPLDSVLNLKWKSPYILSTRDLNAPNFIDLN